MAHNKQERDFILESEGGGLVSGPLHPPLDQVVSYDVSLAVVGLPRRPVSERRRMPSKVDVARPRPVQS